VILKSSLAEQVFEDMFIFWPVDKDVLQALIAKTFKNFASRMTPQNKLAEVTGNWVEDSEFIVDLFEKAIRYDSPYQELISAQNPKLGTRAYSHDGYTADEDGDNRIY
jgi:N utilization substance protein B